MQVRCSGRGDVSRRPQRLQGRAQLDELDDGCGCKGESSHQAERHERGRQHGEERRETEEPCVNPAHDAHSPVGAFLGVGEERQYRRDGRDRRDYAAIGPAPRALQPDSSGSLRCDHLASRPDILLGRQT